MEFNSGFKGLKLQNWSHCKRTLQKLYECENRNSTHEIQGGKRLLQRSTMPITPVARRRNGSDAQAVVYALTTRTWSFLKILIRVRYTLSTGEQLLRGNRACIFRVTQSFECRQLFTSGNFGSTSQKTWIFSNKPVLTSNLYLSNQSPSRVDPELLLSISSPVSHYERSLTVKNRCPSWIPEWPVVCPKELTHEHQEPAEFNTVKRHLFGLFGTASHPDMQKIRIIGFFFENRLHWQFKVRLLLFTVCTASKPFEHAWFEVLEDITLYCTWSDNR